MAFTTWLFGIPTLPVNYDGTNEPTDANLFYCDFAFHNSAAGGYQPADGFDYLSSAERGFTNGGDLTVHRNGVGQCRIGRGVLCFDSLTGQWGESQTNAALGTTNWSLDLGTNAPGVYQLTAFAQDGAGNLSAPATEYFTNLAN
jgi:hypothetical protein